MRPVVVEEVVVAVLEVGAVAVVLVGRRSLVVLVDVLVDVVQVEPAARAVAETVAGQARDAEQLVVDVVRRIPGGRGGPPRRRDVRPVVELLEFVEAAVGQLGGAVDDVAGERAHPRRGRGRCAGREETSGRGTPAAAGRANRNRSSGAGGRPARRRLRWARGASRARPAGDVEARDVEVRRRAVAAPARDVGRRAVATPRPARDVEIGGRAVAAPQRRDVQLRRGAVAGPGTAGRVRRDRTARPSAEVEVGRRAVEEGREGVAARRAGRITAPGVRAADDGLRPVFVVFVVELERVPRPGGGPGVGYALRARAGRLLRPGTAHRTCGRPVRHRQRARRQERAPDGLARGGLLPGGRRSRPIRDRSRAARSAGGDTAVGLPLACGRRRCGRQCAAA